MCELTFSIHSLDLVGGPAGLPRTQLVEGHDTVGIPLSLNQTLHLEPAAHTSKLRHKRFRQRLLVTIHYLI